MAAMKEGLGQIYNTKKPADAIDGMASGAGNIGKGFLAGGAALVGMTVVGAKEQGVKGAAKGFGAGLLSGIGLVAAGAGTGIYQMGRGIANQKEANEQRKLGKEWDAEKREWVTYILENEYNEINSKSEEDYLAELKQKYKDMGVDLGSDSA